MVSDQIENHKIWRIIKEQVLEWLLLIIRKINNLSMQNKMKSIPQNIIS